MSDPKKIIAEAQKKADELVAKISPAVVAPVVPSPPSIKRAPEPAPRQSVFQRVSGFFRRKKKKVDAVNVVPVLVENAVSNKYIFGIKIYKTNLQEDV